MKKAIFTVILAASSFGASAQERSMSAMECMDVLVALEGVAKNTNPGNFGGLFRKDNKVIEVNCIADVRVRSNVGVYTESEYRELLNRRNEENLRQARLRKQQESTLLKSIGL